MKLGIKPKEISYLRYSLLSPLYFPRKKENQLCLIVDTKEEKIYPVPVKIEHIDFASRIIGYKITENLEDASKIVPSNIIMGVSGMNDISYVVEQIITGVSGMEIGYRLRHSHQQLEKAHELVRKFVDDGEFQKSKNFSEKIIKRYAQTSSSRH